MFICDTTAQLCGVSFLRGNAQTRSHVFERPKKTSGLFAHGQNSSSVDPWVACRVRIGPFVDPQSFWARKLWFWWVFCLFLIPELIGITSQECSFLRSLGVGFKSGFMIFSLAFWESGSPAQKLLFGH